MLLVEDGKIALDEKIDKYFTETPESWKQITFRHLLTHTSGMTDYPDDFDFRRDYTEEQLFKIIKEIPLAFRPGEKSSYSNIGYIMLGIIISKVSGKFDGDFLKERIFKPLDMKTARVIGETDIILNRAAGYVLVDGKLMNQEWVAPSLNTTADGSLYMTLLDLVKWDSALYGERLLKKSSIDQMWTSVTLNDGSTYPYGFGWDLGKVQGSRKISHGGAWQGFKAYIGRYIDEKTTVIVFLNLAQANVGKLAQDVAEIYNPKLKKIKSDKASKSVTNRQNGS